MFSQTNDLQKAIDQVNNGGAETVASEDTKAADADSGKTDFSAIQDKLGVPPMPPTEGAGVPPMPAPFSNDTPSAAVENASEPIPVNVPSANAEPNGASLNDTPVSEEVPAEIPSTEATPEPTTPVEASEAGNPDDISKVRENVLRDLIPLMDKVQGDPEYKFTIYREAMDTLHDKGLVSGAYKEASQITDENKKAESLIELMKVIDKLK